MGTEYKVADNVELYEMSCKVQFAIEFGPANNATIVVSPYLTAEQLRAAIIKQIEVLSYISEDPEAVLERFNVDYGQVE